MLRLQFSQGLNNLDSKEPIRHAAFTDKQLALSVLNGSDISISELFKVVKHYDNDFYINHSEQKSQELFSVLGLQLSKGLNILDSSVIIHQSRNIVKGMQKENNAEQLSFFENSTLEDTEVEIPFAVGDEKGDSWFCQYHLTHFIRTRIMQRERYGHSRAFFGLPEKDHRWRCRFFC